MSWKKRLLVGFAYWLACAEVSQCATYYVSVNGSNSNPGTFAQPFQTIGYAIQQCAPGDIVVVWGGVYRQQIVPTNSGTQSSPIVVKPYHDGNDYEEVEVRGLVQIVENTNGVGAWQLHDAANYIYKIQLTSAWDLRPADGIYANQLFANGNILIEARWPNIQTYSDMDENDWALGNRSYTGSANPYTGTYVSTGLNAFATDSLAGATNVFNPGQRWFVQRATVTSNSPSANSVTFSFNQHPFTAQGNHMPDVGDRFYLTNSLVLLDSPGEWFFDADGVFGPQDTLYVRMPNNSSPVGQVLEMRQVNRFVDCANAGWITFERIKFTAAYVYSNNPGLKFDRCTFQYGTNGLFRSGMLLNGSHNTVINCNFLNEAGMAFRIRNGTNNQAVNNVVGNARYLDGAGAAFSVEGASLVSHNTVFNAGGHGIHAIGSGAIVTRNTVRNFGTLVQDVAGINAFGGGNQGGAEWSYNIIHDGVALHEDYPGNNGTIGIRIDNGGQPRPVTTS